MSPYQELCLDPAIARKCDLVLLAVYMFVEPPTAKDLDLLLVGFELSPGDVRLTLGILSGAKQIDIANWEVMWESFEDARWKVTGAT